jgi:hypothetical protein
MEFKISNRGKSMKSTAYRKEAIASILKQLNDRSINISDEIKGIQDAIQSLETNCDVKDLELGNIQTTISTLQQLEYLEEYPISGFFGLAAPALNSNSNSKIKKICSIERVVLDLLAKEGFMSPKEICNSIKDKVASKNLLGTVYAVLNKKKELFIKDPVTKRRALSKEMKKKYENEDLWTM